MTTPNEEPTEIQPPQGEYCYRHQFIVGAASGNALCFACTARRDNDHSEWTYIPFIVYSAETARRVATMFKKDAAIATLEELPGFSRFYISACGTHKRNLELLFRLTKDGTISPWLVERAVGALVTRQEFDGLVAGEARRIWDSKEHGRSLDHWTGAWADLCKTLRRVPSRAEHEARAHQLYLERKEQEAREDWSEASARIRELFKVIS